MGGRSGLKALWAMFNNFVGTSPTSLWLLIDFVTEQKTKHSLTDSKYPIFFKYIICTVNPHSVKPLSHKPWKVSIPSSLWSQPLEPYQSLTNCVHILHYLYQPTPSGLFPGPDKNPMSNQMLLLALFWTQRFAVTNVTGTVCIFWHQPISATMDKWCFQTAQVVILILTLILTLPVTTITTIRSEIMIFKMY